MSDTADVSAGAEAAGENHRHQTGPIVDALSVPATGRSSDGPGAAHHRPPGRTGVAGRVDRRQRWVVRQALVDLAAGGFDPVDREQRAAAAVIDLARAGDIDGLTEILRPDPAEGQVIWTVACYQIGDLTPTGLRDMADPVEAVNLAADCPDPSHIGAELVASTADGLRWTALVRAGKVVRFYLPGERSGDAASDEEVQLRQGASRRWQDQLASWSNEDEPTAPVPLIGPFTNASVLGQARRGQPPVEWPPQRARPPAGDRSEFARTAMAAAAALAEGAGVDFELAGLFAPERTSDQPEPTPADGARTSVAGSSMDGASMDGTSVNGPSVNGPSVNGASVNGASLDGPLIDLTSIDGTSIDGTSIDGISLDGTSLDGERTGPATSPPQAVDPVASTALEVVRVRHGAEIAAVEHRHAVELEAAVVRHSAELAETAARHESELETAFRRGWEQASAEMQSARMADASAIESTMVRLMACIETFEKRLLEVEIAMRSTEPAPPPVSQQIHSMARRLATTTVDHHPLLARLIDARRRWAATAEPPSTAHRPPPDGPDGHPIDTNRTPA